MWNPFRETGMRGESSLNLGLTIHFLGRLELWSGDQLLPPLATKKTQSLFAYLVLNHQRPLLRDELAALFWGDRDDIHARHSLTTALWRIRQLLGKDVLLTDLISVQFSPNHPFWLDVTEFENLISRHPGEPAALAAAVDLYRGDFLEGFGDDWCIEERYHLETLYLDALRRLVEWHDAHGDASMTLTYAQKYLARDPLLEQIHLAVMRSLIASGDLSGARRQWQFCCEVWQQELHSPPPSEMLKQAEELLGAEFNLPLPTKPLSMPPSPHWDVLERPPFVGREQEMAALQTRWKQVQQGNGGLIFVSGEAGIGKTRLIEEFASVVRWHGGTVARGRCYEPEHVLPHQLLSEILRDLGQQGGELFLRLPAWVRHELARLIPELISLPIQPASSISPLQSDLQIILFHAIATLIRQFASHAPLLICLEDLHWAADSTLAAINFLARQINDLQVLYLCTYRPEDIGLSHPLVRIMLQLEREGLAQHLALDRLRIEAIAELVRRLDFVADVDFINRLYSHTEGNAFFSIETLRALARAPTLEGPLPIPRNVRALIESRLQQLSSPAHEWLAYAAVAGRAFDLDLLCRATGVEEEAALQATDELLQQGFLCEGSSPAGADYEFVHHLVHETIYMSIQHRRRGRLHRLIGEALESQSTDPASISSLLAYHFEASGQFEKALHYHDLAVQKAVSVFGWQEAEAHLGRMLHLLDQQDPSQARADYWPSRARILVKRAELRSLLAHLDGRDADLQALSALAESSGDEALRLQALVQRARFLNLDARYEDALLAAEQGLELADHLEDKAARCFLLTQVGFAHYFLGQPQPALAALEAALAIVPESDDETRRHISHILGYVHFHLGNYTRALGYQKEAYAIHRLHNDYNGIAWAGLDIAATCQESGHLDEAEQYLKEHLALARRIGARSAEAYGLTQSGNWELILGNYLEAAELFQLALAAQQELRTEHGFVAAEIGAGLACYHLGEFSMARRWLEQAIRRARAIRHHRRLAEALIGLGLVELAADHPQEGRHTLTEAVTLALESEARGILAAGLAALARAERQLEDLKSAHAHAFQALQTAVSLNIPACIRWGELELGLVHLAEGDAGAALTHCQRALELAPGCGERWIGSEQVLQACAQVFQTLGNLQLADEYRQKAKAMIMAKASHISDPQQRQRYLEIVGHIP